jgi:hypothetical protein
MIHGKTRAKHAGCCVMAAVFGMKCIAITLWHTLGSQDSPSFAHPKSTDVRTRNLFSFNALQA